MVMGLCLSMLADKSAADDAAQETFLKAYQALDDYKASASFSTWLYKIASTRCLDIIRGRKRRKEESLDGLMEQEAGKISRLLTQSKERNLLPEDIDLIDRVLGCLPADYRLILTLREAQGLTYKEIMKVMDCSLDSVKARLRRARKLLQEKTRHFFAAESV